MSLKNLLREHEYDLRVAYRRLRQKLFIARVKAMAKFERATVEFDFAPDVQIGHGVRVIVWPGTHTTFKLGPKSWLRDNVVIHMKGGSFVGGIRTDLRQNVAVQIEGRIILDGENTISYGCSLHSGESIHLGYAAIMAEYATIADSTHFHTTADEPVGENVKFAAVDIGRNTFICPRGIGGPRGHDRTLVDRRAELGREQGHSRRGVRVRRAVRSGSLARPPVDRRR